MTRYGPEDPGRHADRRIRITLGSLSIGGRPPRYGPLRELDVPLDPATVRQLAGLSRIAQENRPPPPGPELTPDRLGLARVSGRCAHGFDVRTQHPALCPCQTEAHE